jgi:hypothetical protein
LISTDGWKSFAGYSILPVIVYNNFSEGTEFILTAFSVGILNENHIEKSIKPVSEFSKHLTPPQHNILGKLNF